MTRDDQQWTDDGWRFLPSAWRGEGGRDWAGASDCQVYRAARVQYDANRGIILRYVDAVRETTIQCSFKCYVYESADGDRTILPRTVVDQGPESWLTLIAAPDDDVEPATGRDLDCCPSGCRGVTRSDRRTPAHRAGTMATAR